MPNQSEQTRQKLYKDTTTIKHKSLVQQVQTSLKAKEGLVLRLGRGTRRNEDGDKILYACVQCGFPIHVMLIILG